MADLGKGRNVKADGKYLKGKEALAGEREGKK